MRSGLFKSKKQNISLVTMNSEACEPSQVDTKSPPLETQLDHGDFVDSEDEGEVEFASEDQGLYASGLFYPICIGETLHNGRYRIDHKLGRGGFSVVWLARDLRDHKNVALKVLSSSDAAAQEHQKHTKIIACAQDRSRLVLCQDFFTLRGSKGAHHVLVLPLLGPNLSSCLMESKRPIAVYMSAANDLLQAVISLHSAGFVHRGKFERIPVDFYYKSIGSNELALVNTKKNSQISCLPTLFGISIPSSTTSPWPNIISF